MNFKELIVWQKSRDLNKTIYDITKNFPKEELFGLTNQIRRASISISSNIAEGKGRDRINEYTHFLRIARGSCTEVECQIILAEDIGYLSSEESKKIQEQSVEILKMLSSLIKKLEMKI